MNTPDPVPPPMMNNVNKATATAGISGILLSYAAAVLSQKLQIPLEASATIAGVAFAAIGRWAGKLHPSR